MPARLLRALDLRSRNFATSLVFFAACVAPPPAANVSKSIESREVPEADEIIPMPEKGGTMIVAVADAFNVHNHDHVEKAQRVEMRLVDLDALPVTDPRFL